MTKAKSIIYGKAKNPISYNIGYDKGYEQGKKDQAKIDEHELNQYRRILTICYEDD